AVLWTVLPAVLESRPWIRPRRRAGPGPRGGDLGGGADLLWWVRRHGDHGRLWMVRYLPAERRLLPPGERVRVHGRVRVRVLLVVPDGRDQRDPLADRVDDRRASHRRRHGRPGARAEHDGDRLPLRVRG